MNKLSNFFIVLAVVLLPHLAIAQGENSMLENTMYQSGKINVVIGVVAFIFIILFLYLLSIERKLRRIEEKEKNNIS